VLASRGPVVRDRYDQLPRIVNENYRAHAILGVPIFWRDQFIGSFGISAAPPRRFDANDVEILTIYSRHAAIAIENARQYQRETARNEEFSLLAGMGHALSADLDLDTLCANAVQMIHEHMGYPNVGLGLIEPEAPETIVIRHLGGGFQRFAPYERRIHISQGIMGAAVRERRAQLVHDVRQDPRYLPSPAGEIMVAELALPIVHGDQVLGVLNLETPGRFDEHDVQGIEIVAGYLAVAIRNARLFADAQRLAALDERHRLARDLHDSITQMVFSASLMAQSIAPAWRTDPAEAKRLSERTAELTRGALTELRALLHELSPTEEDKGVGAGHQALPALERLRHAGLAETIRAEARQAVDGDLACELDLSEYVAQPLETEEALYRVFQEALHNVVKHAHAAWVKIELKCAGGDVVLRVTDNGVGYDPAAPAVDGGGFGLTSMRERVGGLGGSLRVESSVGGGSSVEAVVPSRS
jgi:signal transduction histidine kinase